MSKNQRKWLPQGTQYANIKPQRKSTKEYETHQQRCSDTKDFYKRVLQKNPLFVISNHCLFKRESQHSTKDL